MAFSSSQHDRGYTAAGEDPETYPTPSQRGMWVAEEATAGQLYGIVMTAVLDGPVDDDALMRSISSVVARHAGLRTRFTVSAGRLLRVVQPDWQPAVQYRTVPRDDFRSAVLDLADRAARRPFRLEDGPPLQFILFEAGPENHALTMLTHHMLLDAWSVNRAFDEIFAQYENLLAGTRLESAEAVDPSAQVRHIQHLEATGEVERHEQFWTDHLKDFPRSIDLPSSRVRPARRSAAGHCATVSFENALVNAIDARAADVGVHTFAMLFAAFGLTVARYADVHRLLVGMPVSGRPTRELRTLVAQCALVLPVAISIDDDQSVCDYLHGVQESMKASRDHAAIPLEALAQHFAHRGDTSRNPLVQVVCNRISQIISRPRSVVGLQVEYCLGHAASSPMDIELCFTGPDHTARIEWSSSLWTRAESAVFIEDFRSVVRGLTTHDHVGAVGTSLATSRTTAR